MTSNDHARGEPQPLFVGPYSSRSDFTIERDLYHSNTGVIHLARDRNGEQRVLKQRIAPELGRSKDIFREYVLLHKLQHPNILQCFGYFWERDTRSLFLVLEYAPYGDLHEELQSRRTRDNPLTDAEVLHIFLQLVAGVAYLHAKDIVHRDLKPLNFFLFGDGTVKIGDLGVSRQMSENTLCLNSFYGSPLYISPEIVLGHPYAKATDIWSLGVVLYELLTLNPPFNGPSLSAVTKAVCDGQYEPIPAARSREFDLVLKEMLVSDPDRRVRASQLELIVESAQKRLRAASPVAAERPREQVAAPEQRRPPRLPLQELQRSPRDEPRFESKSSVSRRDKRDASPTPWTPGNPGDRTPDQGMWSDRRRSDRSGRSR